MAERTEKVTVIVPAYNHEKYLIECLESIHNQTYRNFQWIVVDDCSVDNTLSILQEKQKYYGYRLLTHRRNLGISQTLTEVIRDYETGEYISICASDDYWEVNKLERQIEFMESHPEYAMCFCRTFFIDTDSNTIGTDKPEHYRGGYIFNDIITQTFHPPVNYMIRKNVLEEFGYYKKGVVAEDFYMNCMISHKYPIGYIPDLMGYYRVDKKHSINVSYKVLMSHEDTINLYANEPIYKTAYRLHCLRCFSQLSSLKRYKTLSVKYLWRARDIFSINFFKSMEHLIRGLYHIIFIWS